jgi:hypothetical protein
MLRNKLCVGRHDVLKGMKLETRNLRINQDRLNLRNEKRVRGLVDYDLEIEMGR